MHRKRQRTLQGQLVLMLKRLLRLLVRLQERWWFLEEEARKRQVVWLVRRLVVLGDRLWHREWLRVLRLSEVVDLRLRRARQQVQRLEQEVGVLRRHSHRQARRLVLWCHRVVDQRRQRPVRQQQRRRLQVHLMMQRLRSQVRLWVLRQCNREGARAMR